MAAKGYCTANDVQEFLGVTFTAAQTTHAENLIERAEIYIDEETGRGWLVGAQTDEAHYVDSQNVFVRYAPVASVEAVTGRSGLGETEETLTVDEDYEVQDLDNGLIVLTAPGSYDRVLVDYTPVNAVPKDIKQACIDIVAQWMQPSLQSNYGIDSYALPDLTVKFSRAYTQTAVPPTARAIIERYRYAVHA